MPGSRQNGVRTQPSQGAPFGAPAVAGARATLLTAGRLVEGGRYEEAAEAMRLLQAGDRGAAGEALSAARQICLSCLEYHSEARVHREAARGAASRERRLRERVLVILRLAGAGPGPAAPAPSRHPVLAVHCFGSLRVFKDGRALDPWPNRRSRSLFKYLVCHRDRLVPKELLMDLLWPRATARAARNNLNVAIHHLRRMLRDDADDPSWVLFDEGGYRLSPALEVWVDAEEFEHLIASARRMDRHGDRAGALRDYEAAAALYAGDLFADDPYEDWAMLRRRALQDAYLAALGQMGDACLDDEDDHEGAAALYRRALSVDPCREQAHRGLMRGYARSGQRHLALRQYRQCAEALATLGVPPAPETEALRRRIRHGAGDLARSAN